MARPRSEDPKRPLSLSLRSSTIAAVEEQARSTGSSPNAYVSALVEEWFGVPEPPGCPHTTQRKVAGALVCADCGAAIR